jgi:penicillin amidase
MRWVGRILLLLAIVIAAGWLWLRSSLPDPNETIRADGLSAAVTIVRDAHGIPTVRAANERDAAFAMGWLHAQNRLFQMDLARRYGAGRLAEWFSSRAIKNDRFVRTLGLYRAAEQQLAALSPEARAVLESYAAGVNDWLAQRHGALPLEYYLIRAAPEPWKPTDSLVWGKLMSLQLAGNFRGELYRARLLQHLKPEDIDVLYPPYPKDGPITLTDTAQLLRDLPLESIYAALPPELGPAFASNNWVLDGKHTVSGKPMLANDPHLGLTAPGVWYLARIETPELKVAGVTAPGVPFVILGHNEHIAWGFTTTTGDVEDVYIEKLDPNDPSKYLTPGGSQAFATRDEEIAVRGGAPVKITIRQTRHGPVVSDLGGQDADAAAPGTVLAVATTWLMPDDRSPEALWLVDKAKNWDEFRGALKLFVGPQQNMVFADTAGNIGFIAPARIPIRAKGDGYMPSPGWTDDYAWTGFIPFDQLPQTYNPPSGRLVTANNKIVPSSYPFFISRDWDAPNRAMRINQLLDAKPKFAPDDFAVIQADTLSLMAQDLLPIMLRISPPSPRAARAMDRLKSWNFHMDRDLVEPSLFVAWLRETTRGLFADKLGPGFAEYWGPRPLAVHGILTEHPDWCESSGKGGTQVTVSVTPSTAPADCAGLLAASLDRALDDLAKRYGDEMGGWSWGRVHPAHFENQFWANVPMIGSFFDLAIPDDGGSDTVNRADMRYADDVEPFAAEHGPGLRMIVDLAMPQQARFLITPGESGNVLSPHYGDLMRSWRNFAWVDFSGPVDGDSTELAPKAGP